MSDGTISARQAGDGACIQTDLCPSPILAIVAIGNSKAKGDTMKAAELREVVADVIGLLPAALGLDFVRRQWRQF